MDQSGLNAIHSCHVLPMLLSKSRGPHQSFFPSTEHQRLEYRMIYSSLNQMGQHFIPQHKQLSVQSGNGEAALTTQPTWLSEKESADFWAYRPSKTVPWVPGGCVSQRHPFRELLQLLFRKNLLDGNCNQTANINNTTKLLRSRWLQKTLKSFPKEHVQLFFSYPHLDQSSLPTSGCHCVQLYVSLKVQTKLISNTLAKGLLFYLY